MKKASLWVDRTAVDSQSLPNPSLCAQEMVRPSGQVLPLGEDLAPPGSREIAKLTLGGPYSPRNPTWALKWHLERMLELISGSGLKRDPRGGKG